jgi:ABC-type antimicrobial peptide transport system permease subunit
VGVVEDVVMDDPFQPVLPAVILFLPARALNVINLRLKATADVRKTIEVIGSMVERHNPAYPFEYHFVDEQFELKFKTETQAGQLAGVFAGLAVVISCLGLFGLAAYMAERRTKEIGIRKILGASVPNLWALLSKDFLVLVLLSCAIAIPLSAWFMTGWLQNYEYRTDLSGWIFAAAAAGALVITLLTISVEIVKAALQNPVKSLRTE